MILRGVLIISPFFVSMVLGITTKTQVNTLQQIINNVNSETNQELLERVLQTPLSAGPSGISPITSLYLIKIGVGNGVETLQMMMKTPPLQSTRELQSIANVVVGNNRNISIAREDKLENIQAPVLLVPVEAPANFDVSQLLLEEESVDDDYDVIDLDDESLYQDIDHADGQGRQSLTSAFISSGDSVSLSLSPSSPLVGSPGDLIYVKFLLRNNGDVTKFRMTAGVGGVMDTMVPDTRRHRSRQRMVFPGQSSFIQTLTPDTVLLASNHTEEIKIGVNNYLYYSSRNQKLHTPYL